MSGINSGGGQLTYIQIAKNNGFYEGAGNKAFIDTLMLANPITQDLPMMEADHKDGTLVQYITEYPRAVYLDIADGILPSQAGFEQVTEKTARMASLAETNQDTLKLVKDKAMARQRNEAGHQQSLANMFNEQFWYGESSRQPNTIMGMTPRYSSSTAGTGQNLILANKKPDGSDIFTTQGNRKLRSLWLIGFGENMIHGIYPMGSQAGLKKEDKGLYMLPDASEGGIVPKTAGRTWVYGTLFTMYAGLCVADWRCAVRIANIPVSGDDAVTRYGAVGKADAQESLGINLPDLIDRAFDRLPEKAKMGNKYIYGDARLTSILVRQHSEAVRGSTLKVEGVGSYQITTIRGAAIRDTDALNRDEEIVS